MKNRVAIYQREATEMLQNIAQYPGLTEEQLCRFFLEKESTAKILLSHMLKEGRAYRADNGRYYINQEIQNGADDTLSRCIWVLLDFIEQVEYHTAGEFPVEVLCFANGQLYEIVPIPRGKETMLCQLLRLPQKDAGSVCCKIRTRNGFSFICPAVGIQTLLNRSRLAACGCTVSHGHTSR